MASKLGGEGLANSGVRAWTNSRRISAVRKLIRADLVSQWFRSVSGNREQLPACQGHVLVVEGTHSTVVLRGGSVVCGLSGRVLVLGQAQAGMG